MKTKDPFENLKKKYNELHNKEDKLRWLKIIEDANDDQDLRRWITIQRDWLTK